METSKERLVMFYDLKLSASGTSSRQKVEIPPLPLSIIIDHLIIHKQNLDSLNTVCSYQHRNNKTAPQTVYISDIQLSSNKKIATILFNISDKGAANSVYSNVINKNTRIIPKTADEGNDFSAHFVINLDPIREGAYLALFEQTHGLSSKRIKIFLNQLLRIFVDIHPNIYEVWHPNQAYDLKGNKVMITAYHSLDLLGHPSDEFVNDLNKGTLESIELVDYRKRGMAWDTNGATVEQVRSVLLKPNSGKNIVNFNALSDACLFGTKKDYSQARVKFRANNINRSVTLETANLGFANDTIFVKKALISGFSNLLEASYQNVHPEISQKIIDCLKQVKNDTPPII